jgi:hypothetical protein
MSQESKEQSADSAGVEAAGFESSNNSRDEAEAIMNAESPDDVDKDLLEEIESERQERLDPDNRPDGAEVDNTQRTFIAEEARFEDSEISEDEAQDGLGQKEPDPETQAGSSDDALEASTDDDAAEKQAGESDASTGPEPTPEPGRHKA